jgi:hypothetical protein
MAMIGAPTSSTSCLSVFLSLGLRTDLQHEQFAGGCLNAFSNSWRASTIRRSSNTNCCIAISVRHSTHVHVAMKCAGTFCALVFCSCCSLALSWLSASLNCAVALSGWAWRGCSCVRCGCATCAACSSSRHAVTLFMKATLKASHILSSIPASSSVTGVAAAWGGSSVVISLTGAVASGAVACRAS